MRATGKISTVWIALALLAACGDGGGGSTVGGGGIGGTGVSQGPITGFGSVFVNGIEFHTTNTEIEIEDSPNQTEDKLRTGMVVRIEWKRDDSGTYTASRITYSDDVQGPVNNLSGSTFTVLGRTVTVTNLTVFEEGLTGLSGANPLANGQVIEVSGLVDASGAIQATRIELKDPSSPSYSEFEFKGIVTNFNSGAKTFQIAGVTVDYSITPAQNVPSSLNNNSCVELKGDISGTVSGGALQPTEIKLDDSCTPGGMAGDETNVVGLISQFTSVSGDFNVGTQTVRVTTQTRYEDGASSALLANNLKVEAEGTINDKGVLVAQKISLRQSGNNDLEIVGQITAKDASAKTLTVANVTITVNNLTVFDDVKNFEALTIGDTVEIHYYEQGNAKIANRIERDK